MAAFVRPIPLGLVILSEALEEFFIDVTDGRVVEGSRGCLQRDAASRRSPDTLSPEPYLATVLVKDEFLAPMHAQDAHNLG